MIKTRLKGVKGIWPDELPDVLWVYWTMTPTPTGETPFHLTFGSEVVIPIEVGLTNYQISHYNKERNEREMHLHLDFLDEVRVMAKQRIVRYQDMMAKHYNTKVRPRNFQVRDLVLMKVTTTTRDLT